VVSSGPCLTPGRVTSYGDTNASRWSIGLVTEQSPHTDHVARSAGFPMPASSGTLLYMAGGSAKREWQPVSMRLTHAQRRRITRLARGTEPIADPNDLHVVAIFLRGVLSGRFAVKRGWLRGGTWVFLGLGIAGLLGRSSRERLCSPPFCRSLCWALQPSGTSGSMGAGPAPPT
jgi:hypothetical protein